MTWYTFFLFLHSWIRWFILIVGLLAIIFSLMGWTGKKPFTSRDNGISAAFMGLLHLNLLIGLVLYIFLSPYTQSAFNDFGAAMKNSELRFWAVEHILINIIAIAVAQVGRIKAKKAVSDIAKHKTTFIFYTIAFILLLSRIPWGETARLFRW